MLLGASVLVAIVTLDDATPSPRPIRASDLDGFYLVTAPAVLTRTPTSAEVVGRLARFEMPFFVESREGWTHVLVVTGVSPNRTQYDGWVKGYDSRNLIGDRRAATTRVDAARASGWAAAIADDVVRGRVRPGFTKPQVRSARMTGDNPSGDPGRRKTSETAAGTREIWFYPGEAITFAGDRVVEIETVE